MANSRVTGFLVFLVLGCCLPGFTSYLRAQEESSISIMPLPAHFLRAEVECTIDGGFGIALEGY